MTLDASVGVISLKTAERLRLRGSPVGTKSEAFCDTKEGAREATDGGADEPNPAGNANSHPVPRDQRGSKGN